MLEERRLATVDSILEINNLTKRFKIGRGFSKSVLTAVNKATFSIKKGKPEIFTLVGESGSGKSTLSKMILGLYEPSEGNLHFRNKKINELTKKERRNWFMKEVQPIFQNPFETFSPLKKIDSYLYNTAKNFKMMEKGQSVEEYVDQKLQLVGLSWEEMEGRYPNQLSGGQVQRMSIARALITNPSLIIADEPVSMVDASLRMSIVNLFKELRDELQVSIIYVTHDLATAYYVSDRIAIMLRGNIVEQGPAREILDEPMHPYTKLLKESVPQPDPEDEWTDITDLTASLEKEEFAQKGCKFGTRCPYADPSCKNEIPEDYQVGSRTVRCFRYE